MRSSIPVCFPWVILDFDWGLTLFPEEIVRISEALAKLAPSPVVPNHHVDEAIRSFKFSTVDAVSAGPVDGMVKRGTEPRDEQDRKGEPDDQSHGEWSYWRTPSRALSLDSLCSSLR